MRRRARLLKGLRWKRHSPAISEWDSHRLLTNLSLIVAPRFASEALMTTLHHYAFCPHSRFIRLVLAEMGLHSDAQEEKPWERRVPFLELNPAGTIPVFVEGDGLVVPGASVIAEYLDETRGSSLDGRRLLPQGVAERIEVRRLLDWFLVKFHEEVTGYLVTEKIYKRFMTP